MLQCLFLTLVCSTSIAAEAPTPWSVAHFTIEPKSLYAQASEVAAADGTDVTVLDDEEVDSFDVTGRLHFSEYIVYKVLTERGAQGWNSVSVAWEPWHQERPIVRVRVITPDSVVHDLELNTLTDAPAQDEGSNVYSDRRVVRGPLPAIAPGSVVEQEVVVNESVPFFSAGVIGQYYFGRISVPVLHARLTLDTPTSAPVHYELRLLQGMQPEKIESEGRTRLVFERGAMEALEDAESSLPSDTPAYPSVVFSTASSWNRVAKEYAAVVDDRISVAEIKPLVEKLTRASQGRMEKTQAILRYLNREIRYTGVEFGNAAIVPHSPTETLSRKYGDCKDKSTLLVAMLRSAGIPAYIALLNAGKRMDVPADLPGLGLFDHAIVYAPGTPDLWIDATDEYSRLEQYPVADQGRLALVVRPETTSLIRTPEEASQRNALVEFREVHLAEYGPARIVERSQPHGSEESNFRRGYADTGNKNTKQELTNYVKSQYLAEGLDRLDISDSKDFSRQFELILECNHAKRGFTELNGAVAAIRLEGLFYRLPSDLQKSEKTDDSIIVGQKPKAKRTADYALPEAFVTEWRYTITPPAGFQPKKLPKNVELKLGPSLITEEFAADKENVVHATLRFDTRKRRMSISEANELRDKVVQLLQEQPIMVYFEPSSEALAQQGKIREGLQLYRDLIALHPKDAIHHLRMANALLSAGLGEAARREAQTAVKLDPSSALAETTLAQVLEYDIVGRRFRPGSDYAGAEAAFREAEKLDPKDKGAVANLAILLEFNRWGLRYGPGAKLKEAIAEYRKLTLEEQSGFGIQNNLPITLLYAGEFAEAQKAARSLSVPPLAVIAASEAAQNGSQAGLSEARMHASSDEQFKEIARAAGAILENLRKYALAADFKEAAASSSNASDMQAEASLLRRTQPHEKLQLADDPSGVALRFELLTDDPELKLESLRAIASHNGATTLAQSDVFDYFKNEERETISKKSREGEFSDVGVDFSITRALPSVKGNDATGYKVTLWPSASYKRSIYVVKEDGHYKVLATSQYPAAVGLEVLDRISANDLPGARVLLDWLREDIHLAGGDDPLAGETFPRCWTKGKEADAARIKLAAATILVRSESTLERGIAILEDASSASMSAPEKTNIVLALAFGYQRSHINAKGLHLAVALHQQYPESDQAFRFHVFYLRSLGKIEEADHVAQERLALIPGDIDAVHQLFYNAVAREDYARAHALSQQIVNDGKGSSGDLNQIAWFSLFAEGPHDSDVEAALKSAQLSNNAWGVLHTLGSVYAEIGKLKEAREVLVQAMDSAVYDEPKSEFWYAFGRIAEQAGERELALANYGRVEAPKEPREIPGSSYRLAQTRIKAIKQVSK